jgi:hypothetical protein
LVTAPLGAHELIVELLQHRMQTCMDAASGSPHECTFCDESRVCRWRYGGSNIESTQPRK